MPFYQFQSPFRQIFLASLTLSLAYSPAIPYTVSNTRAVPLARKGDAHQGRVFSCARGYAAIEEAA